MYERLTLPDASLLGLRIREDITPEEVEAIVDLIHRQFAARGPVRLMVVYEGEPGLAGAEGLYENLRFAKLAGDKLARMAVSGQHAWETTWVGLFGLFGGIETRYFIREDTDGAIEWLGA